MKQNKLLVKINKSVEEVFSKVLNPENTPKWVNSIVFEQTNEWPVKKGSIYRNKNRDGKWSVYEVTEFKENEMFVFTKDDKNYQVMYKFRPVSAVVTELEYNEWVNTGEPDQPFTQEILNKLKFLLENESA